MGSTLTRMRFCRRKRGGATMTPSRPAAFAA